jgi:glycosyltransferase involved in cell wall biosynthesis
MFSIFHKRKLVSTIIPVFDSAQYLEQCLDSVCNQAIDDHEIIVINDNCTDNSPTILNKYKRLYPFIKIVTNKQTSGPGFSRNLALRMAKGKYLAFLDSDDYLGGQYFESLIKCGDGNSSDIVFSDYKFIGEDTSRCRLLSINLGATDAKKRLIANASHAPWAKIYLSKFVKKNGLRFHGSALVGEDIPFTWLSYILSDRVNIEKEAVYFYRLNPAGCDNITDCRVLGILESLAALKAIYEGKIKQRRFDDLFVYLMLGNIHYNFEKIENSKSSDAFVSEYIRRSKILFSDFPASEIIDNDYLSEQQKDFYEKHINKHL